MTGVNKAIIVGNIGKKPESKFTNSGDCKCTFSLATSEKYTDSKGQKQEKTEWHNIVIWKQLAEIAAKFLDKGSKVYIEGKLQTRNWDDNDGKKCYITEIVARNMVMLGGKNDRPNDNPEQASGQDYNPGRF